MEKRKFKFSYKWPDLFFYIYPNVGYNAERDGPLHKYLPSLIESRLEDISSKYLMIFHSRERILEIVKIMNSKYDEELNELSVDEEFRDLVLYTNYLFMEARAILDLLGTVLHYLHKRKTLPRNFKDLLFDKKGRHLDKLSSEKKFYDQLLMCKGSTWLSYLISMNRTSLQSIRDLSAHETHIMIDILPKKDTKELRFLLNATRGVKHSSKPAGPELVDCIGSVTKGISGMLMEFRKHYSQEYIRQLLEIDIGSDGLFNNPYT